MNLHEMKLHDEIKVEHCTILRVPGGWVYRVPGTPIFVPYSDEFNEGCDDYVEDKAIGEICGDKVVEWEESAGPLDDSECPPLLVKTFEQHDLGEVMDGIQEIHDKACAGVHVPPVLGKFPGFAGKLVRYFELLGDLGHFQSEKSCKSTMAILKQLTGEQAVACLVHAIEQKSEFLDKTRFTDWTPPTHNLPTREDCGINKSQYEE